MNKKEIKMANHEKEQSSKADQDQAWWSDYQASTKLRRKNPNVSDNCDILDGLLGDLDEIVSEKRPEEQQGCPKLPLLSSESSDVHVSSDLHHKNKIFSDIEEPQKKSEMPTLVQTYLPEVSYTSNCDFIDSHVKVEIISKKVQERQDPPKPSLISKSNSKDLQYLKEINSYEGVENQDYNDDQGNIFFLILYISIVYEKSTIYLFKCL